MSNLVELSQEPEVWKCTVCGSVALKEELLVAGARSCPQCKSEDVFPAFDGGWKELRPISQPVTGEDDRMEGCSTTKGRA